MRLGFLHFVRDIDRFRFEMIINVSNSPIAAVVSQTEESLSAVDCVFL